MEYKDLNTSTIDLFCGAGGLTFGLRSSGLKVVAGFDIDPHCKYVYEENNPGTQFFEQDINDLAIEDIEKLFEPNSYKILVGCAPCQYFSKYARSAREKSDEKWTLVRSFGKIIEQTWPDIVSMENVPELASHPVFNEFVAKLTGVGYHVSFRKVFCPAYGIPQQRERLVLLASRFGDIQLMPPQFKPEEYPTVRSAIGSLSPIAAGEKSSIDPFHISSKLSDINLKRIRASKAGGTWRDWDDDLVSDCHRQKSGQTYVSVYGRMEWDKPSPTITTQYFGFGNGRFGHPDQDRAISLREGAILQSFPPSYKLARDAEKARFSTIGRIIGNAVPPKLGEVIGQSIIMHLKTLKSSRKVENNGK